MRTVYTLNEYVKRLRGAGLLVSVDADYTDTAKVTKVACNSKDADFGTLFICKGNHFKKDYLKEAFLRGAFCYVSETVYEDVPCPCIAVTDVRAALAEIADLYYNCPWQKLGLIGVTGTKGKTTVVHYIKSILDLHFERTGEPPCGLVSTVESFDGKDTEESVNSTPESLQLEEIFDKCSENGLKNVVCEVSSQALKYHRVRCVKFDTGVFTNIGEDHISPVEHPNFEDYFDSKLKLFSMCGHAVINKESDRFDRIRAAAEEYCDTTVYGHTPDCVVYVSNIRKENGITKFDIRTPLYEGGFSLRMAGFFNVDNAAAAIAATLRFGVPYETARDALAGATVSGRMETYSNADKSVVAIVDYAHNALSFETLFSHVKNEYPGWRIVSVFGSVGNKAEVRRYALGDIAGKYSDYIYITSEHPDYEDPYAIAAQIAEGVTKHGTEYTVIPDREQAVITAVSEAAPRTVVMILGVGDETTQRINGVLYPRRSDSECALTALADK
ncbi:MAG: UDP-N-acetylmuramoyl-L-alanyl-D-glutamate--2,6-diaminopimelate ligase [Clostridia bacterium]|nr:UDP-N-acetylmuramoyl-L-alanyl-D-glutamate--2,6-diaminopimelate ligase [Clostridia bacterium]